jgi:hypothetical protein
MPMALVVMPRHLEPTEPKLCFFSLASQGFKVSKSTFVIEELIVN